MDLFWFTAVFGGAYVSFVLFVEIGANWDKRNRQRKERHANTWQRIQEAIK